MSKLDDLERRWNACNGKAFHFDDQNFMSYLWTEVPSLLACARLVRDIAEKTARLDGGPVQTLISIEHKSARIMRDLEGE